MRRPIEIVYVLSEIQKALTFERLTEMLDPTRFRIRVLLLNPGPSSMETFLRERGTEVVRIPLRGKKDWLPAMWRMWTLFRRWRPDVVHCHLLDATRLGLPAAWLAGVRRRIYSRHHSSLHHRYHPKGVWFDHLCNRLATQVVATCGCVREILLDWEGLPESKLVDIPYGFLWTEFHQPDTEQLRHKREEYGLADRFPVVGGVGRFVDWKGFQYLIPGFASILADYPDAVLVLPNDNSSYRSSIDQILRSIPERNYRIIPHQASPGLLFNLFDLFVHVPIDPHVEAFGQIYVESLVCGLPSIFTLSGIAREIARDGENCLVVPFEDSQAIGAALRRLLADPKLMESFRERAFASLPDELSMESHMRSLEALYEA